MPCATFAGARRGPRLTPGRLLLSAAASAPLRYQLALALGVQKQFEAAEPLLEQVLELEPTFTEASLALVSVLRAQGKAAVHAALASPLRLCQRRRDRRRIPDGCFWV